jgi:hypothetical protein
VTGWSQLIGGGNLSDGQYYACWDEDRDNNGFYEYICKPLMRAVTFSWKKTDTDD